MTDISFGETYHYELQGFGPPMPGEDRMGMWGFNIALDPDFADAAKEFEAPRDYHERFHRSAVRIGESCAGYEGNKHSVGFLGDTLLLTNVSVPGNACSLDVDREQLSRLGTEYPPRQVLYAPHNVDTAGQAAGLLAIWADWYITALATLTSRSNR